MLMLLTFFFLPALPLDRDLKHSESLNESENSSNNKTELVVEMFSNLPAHNYL